MFKIKGILFAGDNKILIDNVNVSGFEHAKATLFGIKEKNPSITGWLFTLIKVK